MSDRARRLETHERTDPATWQDHWRLHQPGGSALQQEHMASMGKLAVEASPIQMRMLAADRGVSIEQVYEARRRHIAEQSAAITIDDGQDAEE